MSSKEHINSIAELIQTIRNDCRDKWPDTAKSYVKGENVCSGYFGVVRFAECRDRMFGFEGLEVRRCVIKTVYLQRHLDAILLDDESAEYSEQNDVQSRLANFYRSLVMDFYVLNRCRHENILHSHSVFMTDGDLNIVLPRFYVLSHLIDMYKSKKQYEVLLEATAFYTDFVYNI